MPAAVRSRRPVALNLKVQDDRIVKVSSPFESTVTSGNLCIKGRFGTTFVQERTT